MVGPTLMLGTRLPRYLSVGHQREIYLPNQLILICNTNPTAKANREGYSAAHV